ncbi:hypothetical protein CPB83DRAFT_156819 [Crepidotus variabilis]|uniref:Uncharacterized protein n=1 Tax=Crepidotus variabilis TaxID=179855 RepID=A0A9P6EJA5_9AGAR|nr:hypothetical protein CPB83DRAFT_156819 [Crepidotus variabilis]
MTRSWWRDSMTSLPCSVSAGGLLGWQSDPSMLSIRQKFRLSAWSLQLASRSISCVSFPGVLIFIIDSGVWIKSYNRICMQQPLPQAAFSSCKGPYSHLYHASQSMLPPVSRFHCGLVVILLDNCRWRQTRLSYKDPEVCASSLRR